MLKKAWSIAEPMEMADRNTHEFHPSSSQTIQVHKQGDRWNKKVRTLNDYDVLL